MLLALGSIFMASDEGVDEEKWWVGGCEKTVYGAWAVG